MEDNKAFTTLVERFTSPVEFAASVRFEQLPEVYVLTSKGSTTVSVLDTTRVLFSNTGAVSVTNFTGGQQGQEIKVLGDGFTTIVNSSLIRTNTGSNKLLAVNKVYTFTRFSASWVENA